MDYLKFDKAQLVNTEYSLQKEFIRTNRAGSFASSTIIGCNIRKYHGLLICPIENFAGENHVLLSSLDASLIQRGMPFNLGIHKFPGEYSPKGHKYVREYSMDPLPSITYRVGGMVLKKEFLLVEKEQRVLIRYTLVEANSPTSIRFQPFVAFRNIHSLTKANLNANTKAEIVENGIGLQLYQGFPHLYMQTSKKSEFVHVPDWYYDVEYREEKLRGYECHEDLYVPGYFEMRIKKNEPIVFSAGTERISPTAIVKKFNAEVSKRVTRDSFEHCLENSAEQFISRKENETNIINGFPWFSTSERNTYLALPGLTLARNDETTFLEVLNTAYKKILHRYSQNKNLNAGKESADVPLWLFWTLQKYVEYGANPERLWQKYGTGLKQVLDYYRNGSRIPIKMHNNALLFLYEKGRTWMNVKNNGIPLNKRMGYVVELNALWYNAVCFALEMATAANDKNFVAEWTEMPNTIKKAFVDTFWSEEKQYLFDYVTPTHQSRSIRPNQLFALSLPHSCLNQEQQKSILDVMERDLLTPRGLRTLSPDHHAYVGTITGNEWERNGAFHFGSVFPWLFGHFADAYLKLYKATGIATIQRHLNGFEDCLHEHGLGSVSEIYDGNPPHRPNEATSYALSVAEIIRVSKILNPSSF